MTLTPDEESFAQEILEAAISYYRELLEQGKTPAQARVTVKACLG